jgi:hypothetical protein
MASENPNVRYTDIEGAGHNVFDTHGKQKANGRRSYRLLFDLIDTLVTR